MKYQKWWMPLELTLISTAVFTGSFFIIPMFFKSNAWASLPFVFACWGLWLLILLPMFSIVYARKTLVNEKYKILFTVYNSVLIILPCVFRLGQGGGFKFFLIVLIPFVWAELWAMIGIFVKRKN